jgi:hypothetical protein
MAHCSRASSEKIFASLRLCASALESRRQSLRGAIPLDLRRMSHGNTCFLNVTLELDGPPVLQSRNCGKSRCDSCLIGESACIRFHWKSKIAVFWS